MSRALLQKPTGNPHFTTSQAALNDAIMVIAFAPIVALLLGLSGITATVVGVLIEVSVRLSVVWVVNRSKGWYEGAPAVAHNATGTRKP